MAMLLLTTSFLVNKIEAQKYNKTNISTCFYAIVADDEFGLKLDKATEDSIYNRVIKIFADSAGLHLKPMDFLKGKVAYDFYDHPLVRGKKAAKSGATPNYFRICIYFSKAGIQTSSGGSVSVGGISKGNKTTHTKVKVKLEITIFDENGKEVIDDSYTAKSQNEIIIKEDIFKIGLLTSTAYQPNDSETFRGLLDICTINMAKKIK